MFNKFKQELQDKFKKKAADDANSEAVSDTQSNSSLPPGQQPAQQITFNLSNMEEFSHEELQQVIRKYDGGLTKLRAANQEKAEKISMLEQQQAKANQ